MGVSISLMVLALASHRRSGLPFLLIASVGLGVHALLTLMMLILGHFTDVLSDIDGYYLLALDVAVFAAAGLVALLGGGAGARSS